MPYAAAADTILVVHFAFVMFVVFGGLLVLRWPRFAFLHLPAALWGALIEFSGWICPLTPLEIALRQHAGDAGYAGGFVEHYITAVLYPDGLTREIQIALGILVLVVNAAIYMAILSRSARK
jgi:Protein of Unknown function (DUF2784)